MFQLPKVIAHRGLSHTYPENTFSAFSSCLKHNVKAVEFDIQLSLDKIPVLFHDRDLFRINQTNSKIHELMLSDIKKIDAGSWFDKKFNQEKIITLTELFEHFKEDLYFFIEIKNRENSFSPRIKYLVENIFEQLAHFKINRYCILSFDTHILDYCHQLFPNTTLIQNLYLDREETILDYIDYICVHINRVNDNNKNWLLSHKKKLISHCCDSDEQVKKSIGLGVSSMMSNKADWLLKHELIS